MGGRPVCDCTKLRFDGPGKNVVTSPLPWTALLLEHPMVCDIEGEGAVRNGCELDSKRLNVCVCCRQMRLGALPTRLLLLGLFLELPETEDA